MAMTAAKGFFFRKSLIGLEHPATQDFLLDDSGTFTIGDVVYLDSDGLAKGCGTGGTYAPIGVIAGLVDQNGTNVFSPRASGTTGATLTGDDTLTTSSTNSTDATRYLKAQVIVDTAGLCLFYNDATTTLTQSMVGSCFDMGANDDQIDVSTTTDGTAVWQLIQLDPDGDADLSKGLFRLNENQWFS